MIATLKRVLEVTEEDFSKQMKKGHYGSAKKVFEQIRLVLQSIRETQKHELDMKASHQAKKEQEGE